MDTLGVTYSYGCEPDEIINTTTYPNTSCIVDNPTGAPSDYLDEAACLATKCSGQEDNLSRIYWQKVSSNLWAAETTAAAAKSNVPVDFLDWGDNLESKSWTLSSTIRVETQPFKDHTSNPLSETDTLLKRGYQMWHVYGQGTNEQWGVRVTADGSLVYGYNSPYSIIRTAAARINFAKLSANAEACPTAAPPAPPYASITTWNAPGWQGACTLKDEPYTAELNVGGKYVYGYNWTIKRDQLNPMVCGGDWAMAGWWRLTFYTPRVAVDGTMKSDVRFDRPNISTGPPDLAPYLADPQYEAVTVTAAMAAAELEEGDTGPLYAPVIDVANNLTYIDICIRAAVGGGRK